MIYNQCDRILDSNVRFHTLLVSTEQLILVLQPLIQNKQAQSSHDYLVYVMASGNPTWETCMKTFFNQPLHIELHV